MTTHDTRTAAATPCPPTGPVRGVTKTEIYGALNDVLRGVPAEHIRRLAGEKGGALHTILRVMRRYDHAFAASENFGLIGVGSMSFAEHRTGLYVRRTGIVLGQPYVRR